MGIHVQYRYPWNLLPGQKLIKNQVQNVKLMKYSTKYVKHFQEENLLLDTIFNSKQISSMADGNKLKKH